MYRIAQAHASGEIDCPGKVRDEVFCALFNTVVSVSLGMQHAAETVGGF